MSRSLTARATVAARTAGTGLALTIAATLTLAACSSAVPATPTVADVAAERSLKAEARLDTLLASSAEYLTERWPDRDLPATRVERWLGPADWQAAFSACATQVSGVNVQVDLTAGIVAEPPPATDDQLFAVEVAIYLCQGRYPPPTLARSDPGPVEIAWVAHYARTELPACLRRLGVVTAPLGTGPFAILAGGSTPGWNPYADLGGDVAELRRAQAACPHPSTVLSALSAAGDSR